MPRTITFDLDEHGCCSICNPCALADEERPCARVRLESYARAFYVCEPCFQCLAAAFAGEPGMRHQSEEVSAILDQLQLRFGGSRSSGSSVQSGGAPHVWVEEKPLRSGRRVWTCQQCKVSISPNKEQVHAALALQTCPFRVEVH